MSVNISPYLRYKYWFPEKYSLKVYKLHNLYVSISMECKYLLLYISLNSAAIKLWISRAWVQWILISRTSHVWRFGGGGGNVPKSNNIYNLHDLFFRIQLKTPPCYCNLEVYNGVSNYCSNHVTGWLQNNSVRIFQLCDRHWIFRRFTSKRDSSDEFYFEFSSLVYHWRLFSVTKKKVMISTTLQPQSTLTHKIALGFAT
jgi:hypothetical protein